MFYWDQPFLVGWVGWDISCSIGEKPFLVGLVINFFNRPQTTGADPGISERGGGGVLYTISECHLFMSLVIPDTTFAKCTLSFHNLTNSRMVQVK